MLVDPEELARHLDDPAWVVFDVRHDLAKPARGREAYAAGHIPGAFFLGLDDDLSGAKSGRNGRHPLPPLDGLAAKLNACGVAPGVRVVAYDDTGGSYAVRLWWMLRWLGHDDVVLLDGGFPRWVKEGHPVSTHAPPERRGAFAPRPMLGAIVDAPFVEGYVKRPDARLVDARAADRFAGRNETIDPVAGHVPGAVNRFWQQNLAADGRFKAPDMLRAEFAQLLGDVDPASSVHMCGSGVTACHNLFALALAGLPAGRLYPGSWSEWCADASRPVARGG